MGLRFLLTTLLLSLAATLGAADAVEPKPSPRPSAAAATSVRTPAGRSAETNPPREADKDRALELIFADDFECGDTSRWGGRCTLTDLDLPLPARRRR